MNNEKIKYDKEKEATEKRLKDIRKAREEKETELKNKKIRN